jgi:hypothetical protein
MKSQKMNFSPQPCDWHQPATSRKRIIPEREDMIGEEKIIFLSYRIIHVPFCAVVPGIASECICRDKKEPERTLLFG